MISNIERFKAPFDNNTAKERIKAETKANASAMRKMEIEYT